MDMPVVSAPKRRTILTGAAWSTPVIAAAIAAPSASASEVPSGAEYHWGSTNMILDGASGELRATYSTTISFSGQTPPNNATMTLLVTFDKDVTITSGTAGQAWTYPANLGPSRSFLFTVSLTSASWSLPLSFNLAGSEAGILNGTSAMGIAPSDAASWAPPVSTSTTLLQAGTP